MNINKLWEVYIMLIGLVVTIKMEIIHLDIKIFIAFGVLIYITSLLIATIKELYNG